jgi:nucleoid DNA-binding protein
MRVPVEWRSASLECHKDFCKKNPNQKISYDDFKRIIYGFNQMFIEHILETGEKIKLPAGIGEFSIEKKKKKKIKIINGKEVINLSIDWKKTKEKGKRIYNFNYHTEGYLFGWKWFRKSARFKSSELFFFKPARNTSRLLNHYLRVDEKYQHIYAHWNLI